MESLKELTFFSKYNDHITKLDIRLALVYSVNEGVIVDRNDQCFHYLNSGIKRIELLCGRKVIHFAYQLFERDDRKNDYYKFIMALTPTMVYCVGSNVSNVS